MIGFDLSEILMQSGYTVSTNKIKDLLYQLSVQTSGYVSKLLDMRDGEKPGEGQFISHLPTADATKQFVFDAILREQNNADIHMSEVYSDNAFQMLIASGYIPLGWLHKNCPENASALLNDLKTSWNMIVSDYAGMSTRRFLIYTRIYSFGMFTQKVVGHEKPRLMYFLVPINQTDSEFLLEWVSENHIRNIMVMSEKEYSEYLVNHNYKFLFKFDKVVDPFHGVIFRISSKLKETVPGYLINIGCDRMCFFPMKKDAPNYAITSNRYMAKEIRRGETVDFTVSLPVGYAIGLVSINGISYFPGTANMDAAGIQIVESDANMITGYKMYDVSVSGIRENSKVFVDACEDLTGKRTTKKMISKQRSTLTLGDEDASINLVFKNPFVFLNTNKVKVYAQKDDMSDWELVGARDILLDGHKYVERKAVFGETVFPREHKGAMDVFDHKHEGFHAHYTNGSRPNPNITYRYPHPYGGTPTEINPEARAILYGVTECGSIIISFDGYTDYKYFKVTFDDRAMIACLKVAGVMDDVDVIPVIEDFIAINPNMIQEPEAPVEPPVEPDDSNPETPDPTNPVNPDGVTDKTGPADPETPPEGGGTTTGADKENKEETATPTE